MGLVRQRPGATHSDGYHGLLRQPVDQRLDVGKIIDWRPIASYEVPTAAGDGLLIWGRVTDGRVVLEPAFRVHARPTPRASKATHTVVLSDANGSALVELPIAAEEVDHASGRDERHFAVVVPWSDQLERSVARIAVRDGRTPFPAAVRMSASGVSEAVDPIAGQAMPDPAESVESVGAGASRVTWNAARYPMALVRDAATGEILSFLRKPGDGFADRGQAVEIVFSDGVRSSTRKISPRR